MAPRRRNPRAAHRVERLGELLREIIGDELRLIDDERLDLVSFSEVRTDRDLTHARVWYVAPEDADDAVVREALEEHRVRLQAAVGRQARLRRVPPLSFEPDEAVRTAGRIEEILRDLGDEAGAGHDDTDTAGDDG